MKRLPTVIIVLLAIFSVVAIVDSAQSTLASSHNAPNPPIDVVGVAGYQYVRVSWGESSTSTDAELWVVTASPGGSTATTDSNRYANVTGLTNGVEYTFTVVASNGDGDSAPSAPITATPSERGLHPITLQPDGTIIFTRAEGSRLNFDGTLGVFETFHTNLDPRDTGREDDIYVVDIALATTTVVSYRDDNSLFNEHKSNGLISGDGRYVIFDTRARDVEAGDIDNDFAVYLYDRQADTHEIISRLSSGELGNGDSRGVAISADGRYVLFNSTATNFDPNDTNLSKDVFLRDRQSGITSRIAVGPSVNEIFSAHSGIDLSDDGRFIYFSSTNALLPGEDAALAGGLFVLDRQDQSVRRVGLDESGAPISGVIGRSISGDGSVVTYVTSTQAGLAQSDIYIDDAKTGVVTRLDLSSNRPQGNPRSVNPALNENGRYVVFGSDHPTLLPDYVTDFTYVYVYDRETTETVRVASAGWKVGSISPDISGDGEWIIFSGFDRFLYPGATGYEEAYIVGNPLKAEGSPVPPDSPINVVATEFDGLVDMDWDAPADNGGLPIDYYTVTSVPDGFSVTTTVTNISPSNLVNGIVYTFKVKATNTEGTGMWSADSNAVTLLTRPDAPTNVVAVAGIERVSVTWTAPPDDDGVPVLSYAVVSSPENISTTSTATSTVVTGLTNGTTYTFTVIATNQVGDSTSSLPSNPVTPDLIAPSPPESVALSAGNATATVTWDTPPDIGTSPLLSYDVSLHLAGATGTVVAMISKSTLDSSHSFSGLANGVRYVAAVSATNSTGAGPLGWSQAGRPSSVPTAALIAFTNVGAISLNPGDTEAMLQISVVEAPLSVNAIQIGLLHGNDIEVSSPSCTGVFNGGSTIGPIPTSSGSVVGCFLLSGTVGASTGPVMTINVTNVGTGTSSRIRISDQSSAGTTLSSGGVEEPITAGGTAIIAWESEVTVGPDIKGSVSLQATGIEKIEVIVQVESDGFFAGAFVSDDGTYRVGGVPAGEHTVTITAPGFLPARFSGVFVDDYGIDLPPVQLRAGLVNDDTVVSILDISAVASRFLKTHPKRTDPSGRIVDLNDDGIVNILDISMVASNFGRGGLQVW